MLKKIRQISVLSLLFLSFFAFAPSSFAMEKQERANTQQKSTTKKTPKRKNSTKREQTIQKKKLGQKKKNTGKGNHSLSGGSEWTISDLPPELLVLIFEKCDLQTQAKIRAVGKLWKAVIDHEENPTLNTFGKFKETGNYYLFKNNEEKLTFWLKKGNFPWLTQDYPSFEKSIPILISAFQDLTAFQGAFSSLAQAPLVFALLKSDLKEMIKGSEDHKKTLRSIKKENDQKWEIFSTPSNSSSGIVQRVKNLSRKSRGVQEIPSFLNDFGASLCLLSGCNDEEGEVDEREVNINTLLQDFVLETSPYNNKTLNKEQKLLNLKSLFCAYSEDFQVWKLYVSLLRNQMEDFETVNLSAMEWFHKAFSRTFAKTSFCSHTSFFTAALCGAHVMRRNREESFRIFAEVNLSESSLYTKADLAEIYQDYNQHEKALIILNSCKTSGNLKNYVDYLRCSSGLLTPYNKDDYQKISKDLGRILNDLGEKKKDMIELNDVEYGFRTSISIKKKRVCFLQKCLKLYEPISSSEEEVLWTPKELKKEGLDSISFILQAIKHGQYSSFSQQRPKLIKNVCIFLKKIISKVSKYLQKNPSSHKVIENFFSPYDNILSEMEATHPDIGYSDLRKRLRSSKEEHVKKENKEKKEKKKEK